MTRVLRSNLTTNAKGKNWSTFTKNYTTCLRSQARGHDADLGRVVLSHPNLNNPIVVPLQNLNADTVMSEITKVLNSNGTLSLDEHLLVTVGSIDLPKGGGGVGINYL